MNRNVTAAEEKATKLVRNDNYFCRKRKINITKANILLIPVLYISFINMSFCNKD